MHQDFFFPNAIANINGGNEYPNLHGQVKFFQKRNFVLIEANVNGLPENNSGFFGFHIHEGGDCTGEGFSNTKNHYNPRGLPHPSHAGDLPPLMLCNRGAYLCVATDRFAVSDIIGKTVVIHNMADDFTSQPSGNAGTKIACGVISQA
jgi:Cu-Zn family superoxide dismutase